MLDELTADCHSSDCHRTFEAENAALIYRTDAGERRVYECACGAVTITVHR